MLKPTMLLVTFGAVALPPHGGRAGPGYPRVDTEGGAAPNTIRHMVYHAPTREIWFGTDRNTVGRVRVP